MCSTRFAIRRNSPSIILRRSSRRRASSSRMRSRSVRFRRDDVKATQEIMDAQPLVLLGVHPCDVQGINILDEIFSDSPQDANYLARRANTRIIALECVAPCGAYNLCFDKGTYRVEWGYDLSAGGPGRSVLHLHAHRGRGSDGRGAHVPQARDTGRSRGAGEGPRDAGRELQAAPGRARSTGSRAR